VNADERTHGDPVPAELVAQGGLNGRHLTPDFGADPRPTTTVDPDLPAANADAAAKVLRPWTLRISSR